MDSKKLDQLPAKDSTANDIRNYLARILVEEYDVTPGHANLTCSDWTYSRQKEFLAFSESTYVGIFGHETGAILYNNVHARKKEMEKGLSAKRKSHRRIFSPKMRLTD
jgi:hypothetical protein